MAGKFSKATERYSADLGELFNRSIRQGLLSGLAMAVRSTIHDSSNAAAHWLIAARGKSRPASRRFGQIRDLRATLKGGEHPPIGRRGDHGANAVATERFVRERELKDVIDKLVTGRRPATIFYLYHPLHPDWHYYENAGIDAAGSAGLAEITRVIQNRLAAGQARKNPL